MKVVLAVVFGLVIFVIGFGSMRGLARPHGSTKEPEPLDPAKRVLYWCENCGAEILVVTQGSGQGYRHCGEHMVKREEVLRQG